MAFKVNAQTIGTALSILATAEPEILATYQVLRAIWMTANPGKTEADFIASLDSKAKTLTAESDAVLVSLGYVQGDDGQWRKP